MENTARLFNCARCNRQVFICRTCDRGHRYCGQSCSGSARQESLRAAGRRYQRSRRGRFINARRQRRYRSYRHKVTHQGSTDSSPDDSLCSESRVIAAQYSHKPGIKAQEAHCHFCNCLCSPFIRQDFLCSPAPRLTRPPWVRLTAAI